MSLVLNKSQPIMTAMTSWNGKVYLSIEDGQMPNPSDPIEEATHLLAGVGQKATLMDFEEFFVLTQYVLENDDLMPDDPRLKFIEAVKNSQIVPGWNLSRKRIIVPPWCHR